ncbi:thioredoxin-like domain-containing protein [Leptolyngbya sp. FACHB-17]|uniref:thioredoxin-like domain-containing protein n=1 Tax=unclassified Leptolyngbya TaxID=2650499 RepID=UPI0016814EA8|nr:thioredoxin-like domain-containing protein [Leptolyngbya sp. FACHB-17]MBD2079556.1 redoxin domain-containing protein [Leptolyngbya sp. FACHB-17]
MVRAPEFPKDLAWLNVHRPLSLKEFRGRIVLLDFWTYGCINCIHSLPDLRYLEQRYKDRLTVLGIHSAKFENEGAIENIRQAILRYEITHPVLVDQDFKVWQSYAIRAYPTFVLINPKGYIVKSIAGEGRRDLLDQIIQELIENNEIEPQSISFALEEFPISPLAFPGKVLVNDCLFISDTGHHRIVMSSIEGEVLHIIGSGNSGLLDGEFDQAQFSAPQGMTFDRTNQLLYVADTGNHTIRCVDLKAKTVSTIAGTGNQSRVIYPRGGKALEVDLNSPWDLEKIGNHLFIAMAGAHQIWEMQADKIETFAGTGAEASFDGAIQEAAFAQPSGITTNEKELFIADSETSSIRSINLETNQVKTICGGGDLYDFGDIGGVRETARLQHCLGVEFSENLWIADTYNHKIKQIDANGFCQTIAADSLNEPSGISATATHLFIADTNNHVIRKLNLTTLEMATIKFPNLCAPNVCLPN